MLCIDGLSALTGRFEALFCDVWGVIHDGERPFVGPCAALARWRAEKGPVILISNSPRPADAVTDQLASLGVPRAAWSAIVTSGDATRGLLAERAPGPCWRIGPERDETLYCGISLEFTDPERARFFSCTGLVDDEAETPEDYREALARAASRGLEMICANPDLAVQRGPRLVYCAGALAQLYEAMGGKVVMAGKPFAPIYELAFEQARRLLGRPIERRRVLAVGDGLPTDMAGARSQGLASLFIARGVHGEAALTKSGAVDPVKAEALLEAGGVDADFVLADLAW
ncbi:MAG: TIGR01459 family HAD-type hydrolase [Caulobacteraceae bacterium]